MDLGNPIEIIVHYLLIRGMTCLGFQDEVPMVSALMCMVTHWMRSTTNHDISLLDCHNSPNYYIAWNLNLERILNLF